MLNFWCQFSQPHPTKMSKIQKMAAEDDEIDILGDFSLDDCANKTEKGITSTYSELLKCDYTVHPQWLLDTVSTANWYDNPPQEEIKVDVGPSNKDSSDNEDDNSQPSTSSGIVEWTLYEKELLNKAMEIYGPDYNRISIFLGSKSVQDVKMLIEAEYGINLETDEPETVFSEVIEGSVNYGDVVTENEIPASIEQVICMVSTAEPTVPDIKTSKISQGNPRSVLKKNFVPNSSRSLLKKTVLYSDNIQRNQSLLTQRNKTVSKIKSSNLGKDIIDFKQSFAVDSQVFKDEMSCMKQMTLSPTEKRNQGGFEKQYEKTREKSKFNISLMVNKKDGFRQLPGRKRKPLNVGRKKGNRYKSVSEPSEPIIEKTVMQIVTGSGQALPLFEGEEVIKIEKNNNSEAESDIEVDIDSDGDAQIKDAESFDRIKNTFIHESFPIEDTKSEITKSSNLNIKTDIMDYTIPSEIKELVLSLDLPQQEYIVVDNDITKLEKFLCPEFFEGRSAKTPERYLAIRSHLIQSWRVCRPHYLTKTAARNGLRNCGDVNCIGKVHSLMEQLGAINFNCEQTSYIRPLSSFLTRTASPAISLSPHGSKVKHSDDSNKLFTSRHRKKKILVDGEGGYTITHTEFGEICEAVKEPKQQKPPKKKQTNLIYCKSFSHDHPAPFSVTISLSALILMDFHSHTSHAEVMGLLGGHYDVHTAHVHIKQYVPCDSLEDSGTHCDMCPVSQSEASQVLSRLGMDTVGWLHSHPLFPPWPSPQDLLTQHNFQAALSPTPCLALILSPFWQPGRTASQYRCFYVKNDPTSGEMMAFRFKTQIDCDLVSEYCLESLMQDIIRILEKKERATGSFFVDMNNDTCANAQISYLDKCMSSISHHLKSCKNQLGINQCKEIIKSIRDLVR